MPPTAQANKVPCDRDLPALVHLALLDDAAPDTELLRRYQSICGALLHASTNTQPDIAFSTGLLCRAMGRPTPELFQAALRVLGYLYRNRNIGLRYVASDQTFEGFSDSDWAGKHSTSGFTFHLGSATVSWSSKKQTIVALSSCEAVSMLVPLSEGSARAEQWEPSSVTAHSPPPASTPEVSADQCWPTTLRRLRITRESSLCGSPTTRANGTSRAPLRCKRLR